MEMKHGEPFLVRLTMDLGPVGADDGRILREYGKSEDGRHFTRDVVVPGDITLEGLHYVVQEAFGFTNSHLHEFNLPGDRLFELSDYKVKNLFGFYGVFLHFAGEESPMGFPVPNPLDSFKASYGLPSFTGPYARDLKEESYRVQQEAVKKRLALYKIDENSPEFVDMSISEYCGKYFPDNLRAMKTDLLLADVLAPEGEKLLPGDEWNAAFDASKPGYFAYLTDLLEYSYDFGDGWSVDITRPAVPEGLEKAVRRTVPKVRRNDSPVCVAKSGLMLVDDVGGPSGYIEFLRCVFGEGPSEVFSYEDKDETYRWAHETFGWTRRNHYPSELFNAKSLW